MSAYAIDCHAKPKRDDARWSADLTTRDGVTLHVRPAGPADKIILTVLFRHLSADDRRFRFMGTVQEVDERQIAPMLDERGRVTTFLAFNDAQQAVACATLFDEPDGRSAEVTLSIHAGWKGRGVSWTLLEHVIAFAKAHVIHRVTSIESGEDRAAINLEREMGFAARLLCAVPIEVGLSKALD